MKLLLNAASLFGLALFMLPLAAQENPPAEQPAVEQPAAPAVDVAAPAVPEDVLKLIADTRSPAELNEQELAKRIKRASALAKDEALPQDIRDQLTGIAEAAKGELQTRKQAAEQQKATEDQAAQEQANAEKLAAEKAAKEQAAAEKAAAAQAAQEQAAAEKAAADKAAKEQAAAEKAAAANVAQEQAAADKAAKEQAAAETAAAGKTAKEQAAAEKAAAAQAAQDQAAADKAATDKATADQAAKAQAAADQAAADNAAKDQAANNKAAADQAAKDQAAMKAAADQAANDQAAADQAAKDKAANDQAAKDKADKDKAAAQPAQPAVQPPVAEVAPVAPAPAAPPPPPAPVAEAAPPKIVLAPTPPPKEIPPPPPPPPESKPLPPAAAVAPPPPPAPAAAASTADAQALDNNTGNPAAEKQAKDYLADQTDLNTLTDEQLRARLDATRELMAANELSRNTERALRTKLQAEKDVLRQRILKVEAANQAKAAQANAANPPPLVAAAPAAPGAPAKAAPAAPAPTTTTNNTTNNITNNTTNIITVLTPPQQVLRDRRPAERLDVSELQIRIQIFGDAQSNNSYDPSYRDYWRASVERDRAILRRRLIEERHRREAELALQEADDSFEISADYQPSRRPRRDVFAAEIDYAEMEDVLIAPPSDFGREPKRRYKVDEIARQPKLRDSISRIEIDTIRFGYNEAFIRDEQVGNLDGIAAIIEKIVKKYPNEVFLIEGHTDAPGSAVYNAKLSKLRAESIKKALTSYFVIPGRNLRTVGLGERFLKIPTADAEPENRRVSIARITPLLTQR